MIKKILLIIVLLVGLYAFFILKSQKFGEFSTCGIYDTKTILIANKNIEVLVANDDCKKKLGLSFKKSIENNQGMLFVFEKSGNYGFWMKDMKFPIDIIWISEDFHIVGIEKSVATSTYPKIFGENNFSKYVLELQSGFSDINNVKVGDTIKIN